MEVEDAALGGGDLAWLGSMEWNKHKYKCQTTNELNRTFCVWWSFPAAFYQSNNKLVRFELESIVPFISLCFFDFQYRNSQQNKAKCNNKMARIDMHKQFHIGIWKCLYWK